MMHLSQVPISEYSGKLSRSQDHANLSKISKELVNLKWMLDALKPYCNEKEPEFNTLHFTDLEELFTVSGEIKEIMKPELEHNITALEQLKKAFEEEKTFMTL
jgi:hypothetical protein